MVKIGDKYHMPKAHEEEIKSLNKNYNIEKVVGKGAFGLVCTGTMSQGNKTDGMAVKIINLKKVDPIYYEKFMNRELTALRDCRHDFIVKVFDMTFARKTLYVFMEIALGGDLFDCLEEKFPKGMPEPTAKSVYRMIASALEYIHSKKFAHRDIKAENVLMMDKDRTIAKVTDFGFSTTCFFPASKTNPEIRLLRDTYCGTPSYYPPEIETQQPYDAMKADVWSMGVLLFFSLHRDYPFTDRQIKTLAIRQRNITIKFKRGLTAECKDLLKKQLEIDPKKRLTMAEVVQHKWLTEISSNVVQ